MTVELYDGAWFGWLDGATRPFAPAFAEWVAEELAPRSVVDLGCGTGVYLEALASAGLDVLGVESAPAALAAARVPLLEHDLRQPLRLDRAFDLALCFEVAEHLPPEAAQTLVESLTRAADRVLFSAATPGQGGTGHVNEQPFEHWLELFWRRGFEPEVRRTAALRQAWRAAGAPWWLTANAACFARAECPPDRMEREVRQVEAVSGWLSRSEIRLLWSAARQVRAGAIVEIGSWKGRSTAALALGSRAGGRRKVHAVDSHRGALDISRFLGTPLRDLWSWPEFEAHLRLLGVHRAVRAILADSLVAEAGWQGPPVALLWIDGEHDRDSVLADFRSWRRRCAPGAVVAFHDTTNLAGPRQAVEELAEAGEITVPVRVDTLRFALVRGGTRAAARKGRRARRPVSLLMTTRNEGDYVRRTVDSLLAATAYPEWEVLVLDDASTDGSCEFLHEPAYARDGRLRHVRRETPLGYLALRGLAPDEAGGEVLGFLDAHHWFAPHWLDNTMARLESLDFQAMAGPAVAVLDPDSWEATTRVGYGFSVDADLARVWPASLAEVAPGGRVPFLAGHHLLIPREMYRDLGGWCPLFRGHGTEDVEFCLRAWLLGWDCHVEPSALIAHLYKKQFMNRVTWADLAFNYFLMVHLLLGDEGFQELGPTQREHAGYEEGLRLFEEVRGEASEWRRRIAARQRRTGRELREWLARPAEAR